MELLQQIIAKAVVYQTFVIFGWLAFLTLLALWIVFRQRKVKKLSKLMTANFEIVRSKIEEGGAQNKQALMKQSALLSKALQEILAKQKTGLAETAAVSSRVDQLGDGLRESLADLQQHIAAAAGKGGADAAQLAELAARLDELGDEMAWSHHYYDHLKVLEKAVEKMVGPEKMQQLVAKEKTIGKPAHHSGQ